MQPLCKTEVRGSKVVCTVCGYSLPRRIVGDRFAKNCNPHRPRTVEELEVVLKACVACEHRTQGGGEFDAGLCGLMVKAGCGSCRNIEAFLTFRKSGAACPANPPRFEATPLLEVSNS